MSPKQFIRRLTMSFNAKTVILIIGILFFSTAPLVLSTLRDVEKTMNTMEEGHSRDIINLIILDIDNQYKSVVFHKQSALKAREDQMVSMAKMVVEVFDRFYDLQKKGVLSEKDAQRQALDWVKGFRYYNNDYFFVFDKKMTAIAHPDKALQGKDLSNLKDTNGVYIIRALMVAALERGGDFTRYMWKRLGEAEPREKIAYALFYPKWQWMLGTGLYIDDIEKETQRKIDAVVEQLKESFSKIKFADTGYLFLFNGDKKMLIHPELSGRDISKVMNPDTGNPLVDDLIHASLNSSKPFQYFWDKPSAKGQYKFLKESYVFYFEPLDWYVASSVYKEELAMPARRLVLQHLMIIGLILIASVSFAYVFADKLTRPLKRLSLYTKSLVSNDFVSNEEMEREAASLQLKNKDEIGELTANFVQMERALVVYIDRLKATTAEKERIESELNIAREIQMSILPKIFPPFPNCPELDIFAMIEPAKEVGGDLYDFFFIDEHRFCFVIGDVSGKGVPASLFMAVTKTMIKATAMQGHSAGEILTIVNNELAKENDSCMFVTIMVCVIDTVTGVVSMSNGGHNPPLLVAVGKEPEFLDVAGGIVVGALEGYSFETQELRLNPKDMLFLYTDGVTEAIDTKRDFYSEDRLRNFVSLNREMNVRALIGAAMEDIIFFTGDTPQSDDITFLAMQFKGSP